MSIISPLNLPSISAPFQDPPSSSKKLTMYLILFFFLPLPPISGVDAIPFCKFCGALNKPIVHFIGVA